MIFFVMLAVVLLANFYVFLRLWQIMPPTTTGRTIMVAIAAIAISSFFLYFLIGERVPSAVTTCIYKIGTSWFVILLYFLMLFILLDIVRLTRLVPMDFMRHSWGGLAAIIGIVAVIMISGYTVYLNKKRVELDIVINTMPATQKPLKIVAASDLHLGYGIGAKELTRWIKLINAENPDIVLLTGDIVDSNIRPLEQQGTADILRTIRSEYGVFAIPGNHEYISNLASSLKFLEQAEITVLRDSVALVDNAFYIVGRDDRTNPARRSILELTLGLDRSKPVILLDHQPYHLEEAEANGVDIQLSGHTHRGQVWPISLITDLLYENSYGFLKKGDTNIYVSSGLGIWGGKFRIGTRSEYVVINLSGTR